MQIWNYDQDGFYLSTEVAHPNPLTQGEYLLPAQATTVKPPQFDATANRARWTGKAWELVAIKRVSVAGQDIEVNDWSSYQRWANALLNDSTHHIIDFLTHELPVPLDWRNYRLALQEIVNAPDGDFEAPYPKLPDVFHNGMLVGGGDVQGVRYTKAGAA